MWSLLVLIGSVQSVFTAPSLLVADSVAEFAQRAVAEVTRVVATRRDATLLLATGATPLPLYARLRDGIARGELDLSGVRVVVLDEYLGADGPSLVAWLTDEIIRPAGIPASRVLTFDRADAPDRACRRLDASIQAAGGLDLAVVGIGANGHVGFNEPPSPADAPTRIVTLSDATRASNVAYWGATAEVPRRAYTLGLAQILEARHVLLLATGAEKADVLAAALEGPITPALPASQLRRCRRLTVIADAKAAQSLQMDLYGI